MTSLATILVTVLLSASLASGDEAPIAGTVKAVDPSAQTLTVAVTTKGKMREVTIHMKPGAKVVKFARASEPGKTGFVEQELALADIKPGWIVSAMTKHEGDREVAEAVKVVLER